ncbi:MAG: Ig-like domain-containing protein [Proteobacteria bacterium]|nr:Ig-like domain-containing protein [Pseudomonadota bacterium]
MSPNNMYYDPVVHVYFVTRDTPTVASVKPDGASEPISGTIVITFSEAMDTAAGGAVRLNGLPALTGGTWSNGDTVFTIAYSNLANSTAYTVNISGFESLAGATMADDSSHVFTTAAASDTTPPTVTSVTPSGTDAPVSGNIAITFSEPMNTTAGTVKLNGLAPLTGGTWSSGDKVFTIAYNNLANSTAYIVNISGFKDVAGNTMALDNSHGFMTVTAVIPLTFANNTSYNIPASTVGTPITNINVSGGVSGGVPPYTFSALGLPAGITISAAGVVSGTPTAASAAGIATITVKDSTNASAFIIIGYEAVSPISTRIAAAPITIAEPLAGATPSTTAGGCGMSFTCNVSWQPSDNPFQAGVSYEATITLTAVGSNTFDSGLTVTINGQGANVTFTSGTTVTVKFAFPPTRTFAQAIPLNPAMLAMLALVLAGLAFRHRIDKAEGRHSL